MTLTLPASEPDFRALFETILSTTADFNYIFDRKGQFSYVNRALCDLLGKTQNEVIGRNFHDLGYPVELATKLQAQIERVFLTGKLLKDETVFVNPENIWGYYEYIFVPVLDSEGQVESVAGSTRDISEHRRVQEALRASEAALRKSEMTLAELNKDLERRVIDRTAELQQKAQELVQAQKLEAVGRLTGGIAHDFSNLITGILGITEDIREQLGPDSPHRNDLDEVIKAGQKASALTRQLLAFGRRQVITPTVLNVKAVIQDMSRLFEGLLGEDIVLQSFLAPDTGNIRADPSHIEQVIVNLVVNSRDAMPQGGTIRFETANVEHHSDTMQKRFSLPPGPYVRLTVTDTGHGMSADILEKIFEPFFTTKDQGKGTGLGLSTAYGIIQQNNGDISVTSEVGKGTTFHIYLPRVFEEQEALPLHKQTSGRTTGTETILLIENENIVRRVALRVLEKAGYHVYPASNGKEALELMGRMSSPVDLVITDVVMPEMSGRVVADHLVKKQPGLKVLFMSGHPRDIVSEKGALAPGIAFIQKSFSAETLRKKVRDMLDADPPPSPRTLPPA